MQREVIKWLQSLDLSFPVKNPRRDLANGFLVAEILSRYDKEVSLHSFDNGLAMARRVDNWQQIAQILDRLHCTTVTQELREGTMQQKGELARDLLDQLYMFLTKRTLKANVMAPVTTTQLELPGYVRPTAAVLLREANDATKARLQQATGQVDTEKHRLANETVLQQHQLNLQSLKLAEPQRYQPMPRKAEASYSGQHLKGSRKGGPAAAAAASEQQGSGGEGEGGAANGHHRHKDAAREVQLRGISDDILDSFAERDKRAREEALMKGFPRDESLSMALSRVVEKSLIAYGLASELDQLFHHMTPGTEYFQKCLLMRSRVPAAIRAEIWSDVWKVKTNIAKHIVHRPDEAIHLISLLQFALSKEAAMLSELRITPEMLLLIQESTDSTAVNGSPSSSSEEDGNASSQVIFKKRPFRDDEPYSKQYDTECAWILLTALGQDLVAINAELASNILVTFVIPAVSQLLSLGTPAIVDAIATVLTSFVHFHHLEGLRNLLQVVERTLKGSTGMSSERSDVVIAAILRRFDVRRCVGAEALAKYYAMAALASSNPVSQAAGCHMAQLAVYADCRDASESLLPYLIAIAQRAAPKGAWELRLCALEALLVSYSCIREEEEGVASGASTRRSSRVHSEDPEAHARRELQLNAAVQLLPDLEEVSVALLHSFIASKTPVAASQRRAAISIAVSRLHSDQVTQTYGLIHAMAREAVEHGAFLYSAAHAQQLRDHGELNDEPLKPLAGRVRAAYRTGALGDVWNAMSIAVGLTTSMESDAAADGVAGGGVGSDAQQENPYDRITAPLNALTVAVVLHALLGSVAKETLKAQQEFWMSIVTFCKDMLLDGATNPAACHHVPQAQLSRCTELCNEVVILLYASLTTDGAAEEEAGSVQKSRAINWLQNV